MTTPKKTTKKKPTAGDATRRDLLEARNTIARIEAEIAQVLENKTGMQLGRIARSVRDAIEIRNREIDRQNERFVSELGRHTARHAERAAAAELACATSQTELAKERRLTAETGQLLDAAKSQIAEWSVRIDDREKLASELDAAHHREVGTREAAGLDMNTAHEELLATLRLMREASARVGGAELLEKRAKEREQKTASELEDLRRIHQEVNRERHMLIHQVEKGIVAFPTWSVLRELAHRVPLLLGHDGPRLGLVLGMIAELERVCEAFGSHPLTAKTLEEFERTRGGFPPPPVDPPRTCKVCGGESADGHAKNCANVGRNPQDTGHS